MYQQRNTHFKNRGFAGTPRPRPSTLPVFQADRLVKVMDFRPEPDHKSYHARVSWMTSNFVGRVISSSSSELVLLNLRTNRQTRVSPVQGYSFTEITEEQWAALQAYDKSMRERSFLKG